MTIHDATEVAYKNGYAAGKRDAMKWIPVTERLPKDMQERVLVMTVGYSPVGNQRMDTDRYRNDRWVRYGENVTHWMFLPQPPKEESK